MTDRASPTSGARRPQQQRSSQTLDRILDAAERLLDGRDFEDVTIQEILEGAQVSASSLYMRFADKEALLRALHARHFERVRAIAEGIQDSDAWDELTLEQIARLLIGSLLHHLREGEPRIRSLRLAERRYPDLESRRHAFDAWMLDVAGNYFERRLGEAGRSFDRRSFGLACYLVATSIEAAASAPKPLAEAVRGDDEWLADSLTRMMTSFLGMTNDG